MKQIGSIILILLMLTGVNAKAATYYVVAAGGSDIHPGTQAQPFATIARGIAIAAASGDTLLLADGTYNEHGLDFGTKNLVLQSQSGNPSACIIDCQQLGNGLFIRGGQTLATTVSGLTIQNAIEVGGTFSGSFGSSTMYLANSSATITNCIFLNNNSAGSNGVLLASGSSAVITNCTFTTSTAQALSGTTLAVRGNGAAITNCTFSNNVCESLELSGGTSTVTGCNFTGNRQSGIGMGAGAATVANCSFTGNFSGHGGGISMTGGNLTLSRCSFIGNDGHNFGGGVAQDGGSLVAEHCTFLSNRVQQYGGAISVGSGTATLSNCLIARNTSDFGYGCAMALGLEARANVTVTNCTFAENFTSNDLRTMILNDGSTLTVVNSIFWNAGPSLNHYEFSTRNFGTTTVTYSNVRGGYAGTGNINADPLFVNAAADNYRLQTASFCFNAGSASAPNLPATDLDGAPRILGSAPDMGAYETWLPAYGLYVDKALGNDTTGTGSPRLPFATVVKAIATADNGSSIYIKAGSYGTDRPRITKSLRLFNWLNTGLSRIGQP